MPHDLFHLKWFDFLCGGSHFKTSPKLMAENRWSLTTSLQSYVYYSHFMRIAHVHPIDILHTLVRNFSSRFKSEQFLTFWHWISRIESGCDLKSLLKINSFDWTGHTHGLCMLAVWRVSVNYWMVNWWRRSGLAEICQHVASSTTTSKT